MSRSSRHYSLLEKKQQTTTTATTSADDNNNNNNNNNEAKSLLLTAAERTIAQTVDDLQTLKRINDQLVKELKQMKTKRDMDEENPDVPIISNYEDMYKVGRLQKRIKEKRAAEQAAKLADMKAKLEVLELAKTSTLNAEAKSIDALDV